MRPLSEVRDLVLARCPRLAPEELPLLRARGCVVVDDVVADADLPGFASSAMDGFAVRAADVASATEDIPVVLDVLETVMAGQASSRTVGARQAIRIMTGAPVPAGADAIVPVERSRFSEGTRDRDETVAILATTEVGQHLRGAGDDVRAGTVVIPAGTVLTAPLIGVLAAIGRITVEVVPRPRVGVISTGDELVEAPRALAVGQIRDSNRPMLLARVAESGCDPVDLGWVRDDVDAVAASLHRAAFRCDLIITSGGVSMGEADVVKLVLDRMADPEWIQVAIRPAKPFAVAAVDGVPLLGLPGNPVSSLVSFEVLARPALRQMAGLPPDDGRQVRARAGVALDRRPDGKDHLVRVTLGHVDGVLTATPVAAQGSHQLWATAQAQGLARLPDGFGVAAGDEVDVQVLDLDALVPRRP
ncbi:MAG TPA: gephyrin-like molybdotransferase Glp [Iamia sp.]|jgi:molybdenum cofactor synthesis domain-containing protein|nr:gephyrin-like molybdotransferase Glp [Iamia sp.]